ncbi:uncharacterized protein LOC120617484 [Pteropus medius]|uniref:uncharacterized protein LOC120617484 n=1 Tax=Pteropus vampyrus TaxID=132908 RepID=UPI00196A7977|nr:uncharacterized protein LOC120617484 [Pteropus giganteus]
MDGNGQDRGRKTVEESAATVENKSLEPRKREAVGGLENSGALVVVEATTLVWAPAMGWVPRGQEEKKDVGLGFGILQPDSCPCLAEYYMYSGQYLDLSELQIPLRWALERKPSWCRPGRGGRGGEGGPGRGPAGGGRGTAAVPRRTGGAGRLVSPARELGPFPGDCFPRASVVLRSITATGRTVLLPLPAVVGPRLQGTIFLGVHRVSHCRPGQHCVPTPLLLCLPPSPCGGVHGPALPDPKKGPWTPCGPRRGGPVLHRERFGESLNPLSLSAFLLGFPRGTRSHPLPPTAAPNPAFYPVFPQDEFSGLGASTRPPRNGHQHPESRDPHVLLATESVQDVKVRLLSIKT